MKSLLHAAVSFFVVMAAYWAYATTVVPWVEPAVIERGDSARLTSTPPPESKYAALFASLFGPGHWTRTAAPIVFESDGGLIALRDYETHDDGRIHIEPCVIVYFPTPLDRGSGIAPRDAIVLEAPQGAVIQLDEPVRLSEGKIGRIQHVLVQKAVTIRSDMHHPHPDDDLVLHTKDVQINEDGIWCDSTVTFQYGPHFGSGRTLELRFLPSEKSGHRHGLNVGGVAWIRILKEIRLRLHPGKLNDLHGSDQRRFMPADGTMSEDSTLELTCAGPLLLDVVTQVAEFRRDVEAFLVHRVGDSDKLSCEVLLVHFDEAATADVDTQPLQKNRHDGDQAGRHRRARPGSFPKP